MGVWISGCDYLPAGDEGVTGVRGGEASGATVPEASPTLCTGMPGWAVFVPEGQKGAGVCGRVKNIWNFLNGIVMVRIYM